MLKKSLMLLLAASMAASASLRWEAFDESKPQGSSMEIQVLRADPTQITFHVIIPGMWIKDTVVQGKTYQRISIPGVRSRLSEVGSPELPEKSKYFALPPSKGTKLKVSNETRSYLRGYLIFPNRDTGR